MSHNNVIIVGAGIAGLAAAQFLKKQGLHPILLEARSRYGGRIEVDAILRAPIGRGASWLHGQQNNPLLPLIGKRTQLFSVDTKQFLDRSGRNVANKTVQAFNYVFEKHLHQAQLTIASKNKDVSLATALSDYIKLLKQGDLVQQDLLERKLKFFENYIGAEYELISALYWNEEEILGGHVIVEDAYESCILMLANGLEICLNTIVQKIIECAGVMEVETNQGTFTADFVIVTVPLGVLKKGPIIFSPELPIEKRIAIDRLGMGTLNILAMRFPQVFWPIDWPMFFTAGSPTCASFINWAYFIKKPILLGYVGGKLACHLESLPDEWIIEKTINHFEKIFGQGIVFPENYFFTHWSSDPWSYGSYSYLPVGATPKDRETLAAPAAKGKLLFAGEATFAKAPATVHGAYLSGIREAERVLSMR